MPSGLDVLDREPVLGDVVFDAHNGIPESLRWYDISGRVQSAKCVSKITVAVNNASNVVDAIVQDIFDGAYIRHNKMAFVIEERLEGFVVVWNYDFGRFGMATYETE